MRFLKQLPNLAVTVINIIYMIQLCRSVKARIVKRFIVHRYSQQIRLCRYGGENNWCEQTVYCI